MIVITKKHRYINALWGAVLSFAALSASAETARIDIAAGPAGKALKEFVAQTGLQLLFDYEAVNRLTTQPVSGQIDAAEALKRMLAGTGLAFEFVNERTVTVTAPGADRRVAIPKSDISAPKVQLVQANQAMEPVRAAPEERAAVQEPKEPSAQQGEIIVTGSRISDGAWSNAQDVRSYTREDIQRTGRTSVADFLNTLPAVSVNSPDIATSYLGGTTVRLRGLPIGTTLLLINGQRVQTSGAQYASNYFDIGNIPLAAVERIDVLASGASAIYGSDAIAGVVNVILRQEVEGLQVTGRYGSADDFNEREYTAAWGKAWDRGHIALFASHQDRGVLSGYDRPLSATNDYTPWGGTDNNFATCTPGNLMFPAGYSFNGGAPVPWAAIPNNIGSTPSVQDFAATAGMLNTCPLAVVELSLPLKRTGLSMSASYELTPSTTLFADVLYSRVKRTVNAGPAGFFALPGFALYSLGADNPYNPFGEAVGLGYLFQGTASGNRGDTDFLRPSVGLRGEMGKGWRWQVTALHSEDNTTDIMPYSIYNDDAILAALESTNPATAFNPFSPTPASAAIIDGFFDDAHVKMRGEGRLLNGFVSGPLFDNWAGSIQAAAGLEFGRDELYFNYLAYQEAYIPDPRTATRSRSTRAAFAEVRVPLQQDKLALTLAARHDDYSDFGDTTNPQYALEYRPIASLLLRGSYADSFKAPSLQALNDPRATLPLVGVLDPTTGTTYFTNVTTGGNPDLDPEVGSSKTLGLVYDSQAIAGLRLSTTWWTIEQEQTILGVSHQFIVDNEANFPGRVTRVGGLITNVDQSQVNFGYLEVEGFDYEISYRKSTGLGKWTASLGATRTTRYDALLVPGTPASNRVDQATEGGWSPKWKSTATVGWEREAISVGLTGRYLGEYNDYNSTTHKLGNFWIYDASLRYQLGEHLSVARGVMDDAYLDFGIVNVLDKEPQFSFYNPFLGIDLTQADMRGRYMFLTLGLTF